MAQNGFSGSYKQEHSLEKRKEESARMLRKYVDRIPLKPVQELVQSIRSRREAAMVVKNGVAVLSISSLLPSLLEKIVVTPEEEKVIVEKAHRSEVQCIDKKKYLVPLDLTVGQFASVIRKRISLTSDKAMFLFVDNILPSTGAVMSAVYNEKKDEDGFLYVIYSAENTFGDNEQSGDSLTPV